MKPHNTKYLWLIFVVAVFVLTANASYAEVSISKIRSRANVGDEKLVEEVRPLDETEKWIVGDFDPRWIELSGEIVDTQPETLTLDVYVRIKVGKILASSNGININYLKKTARWQGEKLIASSELHFLKTTKSDLQQKYSLDELMGRFVDNHTWPYVLSFRFVVHDLKSVSKAIAIKNIILEPSNTAY